MKSKLFYAVNSWISIFRKLVLHFLNLKIELQDMFFLFRKFQLELGSLEVQVTDGVQRLLNTLPM